MTLLITEYLFYLEPRSNRGNNKKLTSNEYKVTKGKLLFSGSSRHLDYSNFIEIIDVKEDSVTLGINKDNDVFETEITLSIGENKIYTFHFPLSAKTSYRYSFILKEE